MDNDALMDKGAPVDVDAPDLETLARLASLALTPGEAQIIAGDLLRIRALVAALPEAPASPEGIEALSTAALPATPLRADIPATDPGVAAALSAEAPALHDGHFALPQILGRAPLAPEVP